MPGQANAVLQESFNAAANHRGPIDVPVEAVVQLVLVGEADAEERVMMLRVVGPNDTVGSFGEWTLEDHPRRRNDEMKGLEDAGIGGIDIVV